MDSEKRFGPPDWVRKSEPIDKFEKAAESEGLGSGVDPAKVEKMGKPEKAEKTEKPEKAEKAVKVPTEAQLKGQVEELVQRVIALRAENRLSGVVADAAATGALGILSASGALDKSMGHTVEVLWQAADKSALLVPMATKVAAEVTYTNGQVALVVRLDP